MIVDFTFVLVSLPAFLTSRNFHLFISPSHRLRAAKACHRYDKMGLWIRFLNRVVRNDAMKIDPPEIYNARVFILALCSCFGGTLYVSKVLGEDREQWS